MLRYQQQYSFFDEPNWARPSASSTWRRGVEKDLERGAGGDHQAGHGGGQSGIVVVDSFRTVVRKASHDGACEWRCSRSSSGWPSF
jgi:hypothetical protein